VFVRTCSLCDPQHRAFTKHIACSDLLSHCDSSDVSFFTPDFDCPHFRCAVRKLLSSERVRDQLQQPGPAFLLFDQELKAVTQKMLFHRSDPWPGAFCEGSRISMGSHGRFVYAAVWAGSSLGLVRVNGALLFIILASPLLQDLLPLRLSSEPLSLRLIHHAPCFLFSCIFSLSHSESPSPSIIPLLFQFSFGNIINSPHCAKSGPTLTSLSLSLSLSL
jgi:hypothetical protein